MSETPKQEQWPFFKIIPEGKISHHFKEGVMTGGEAHILQIIVFAPRSQTSLDTDRSFVIPLFFSKEDILEGIHPGVGEHKAWIVVGDQTGAWQ